MNKQHAVACAVMSLLAFSASAVDYTWMGASAAWDSPANWGLESGLPGESTGDALIFSGTPAFMPLVNSAQPSGSGRIQKLTFSDGTWLLSGNAALTLDKGAGINFGNDASNPYIDVKSGASATLSLPSLILGSGQNGNPAFVVRENASLTIDSPVSFSGSARNFIFGGGGTATVSSSLTTADVFAINGTTLIFANPDGAVYTPSLGYKVRINGATLLLSYDNQINLGAKASSVLRLDNKATVNLNGHKDNVCQLAFATDTTTGGTLITGDSGELTLTSNNPAIIVGSTARIPADTSVIKGNIHSTCGTYETMHITTRRGAGEVDLRIEGPISGDGSVCINAVNNLSDEAGIVEFCSTNSYVGTTKVTYGTLRVSTQGAPAISTGKVEVGAAGRLEGTSCVDPVSAYSTIKVAGTLAPGAPVDTLTIGSDGSENNVEMLSGSVLEINVKAAELGKLNVFGALKLATDGDVTLRINECTPPQLTGQYEIISASSGITGSFASIELPSDRYSVTTRDGSVFLRISPRQTLIIFR